MFSRGGALGLSAAMQAPLRAAVHTALIDHFEVTVGSRREVDCVDYAAFDLMPFSGGRQTLIASCLLVVGCSDKRFGQVSIGLSVQNE